MKSHHREFQQRTRKTSRKARSNKATEVPIPARTKELVDEWDKMPRLTASPTLRGEPRSRPMPTDTDLPANRPPRSGPVVARDRDDAPTTVPGNACRRAQSESDDMKPEELRLA